MGDIHADHNSVAAESISHSTINVGITLEQYEKALRDRIAEIKQDHAESLAGANKRADEQVEKRVVAEVQLGILTKKLTNVELEFEQERSMLQDKLLASSNFIREILELPVGDQKGLDVGIKKSFSQGDNSQALRRLVKAAEYETRQSDCGGAIGEGHAEKASYYHEVIAHTFLSQMEFSAATEHFTLAAEILPDLDESGRIAMKSGAARALRLQGEVFLDKELLEKSISLQEDIIEEASPSQPSLLLVSLRWNLAATLRVVGEYELDDQYLCKALALIEEIFEGDTSPIEPSSLYREKSVLLQELGKKSNTLHLLEEALIACQMAVDNTRYGTVDWAIAVGELGASYQSIGERIIQDTGDVGYLLKSIHYSRKARRHFRRMGAGDEVVQSSLNMALAFQRIAHDQGSIPEAVEAMRLAVEVMEYPSGKVKALLQVAAKNVYGLAARVLATQTCNECYFLEAESALKDVLSLLESKKSSQLWANINKNIALTITDYCRLQFSNGLHEGLISRLYDAINYHQKTLSVYTLDNHPYQWAWQKFELAKTYGLLAKLELSTIKIEEAKALLEVVRTDADAAGWGSRIGNIETIFAQIEKDEQYVASFKS